MRYARSWMIVVLLAALPLSGCRLPGHEGPAPKSLVECRRLAQQGVAALDRGRQHDAESLLAKAVAACPADADAHRHYAEALWRRGARKEAIAQLEQSVQLAGDDPLVWSRLAEMYLDNGQFESAWKNADRAIDLDPHLPAAWAIRGGVFRASGQPGDALTCYLRALGYAPKDRAILTDVADLYRQQNQPERSLQTLQCLADTYSPGEEPAQVEDFLGQAYAALGRHDDAVESFSLAVKRGSPRSRCSAILARPNCWPATPRKRPQRPNAPWRCSREIPTASPCSNASDSPNSRRGRLRDSQRQRGRRRLARTVGHRARLFSDNLLRPLPARQSTRRYNRYFPPRDRPSPLPASDSYVDSGLVRTANLSSSVRKLDLNRRF